ncbi:MAG: HlyD family efflux transporter periplasmic adaptor subunit [Anaerolineales bacterium]|nr:HlyD family efflux transporter periplasmic adaptor subunit [Anaerolineales bacterium]
MKKIYLILLISILSVTACGQANAPQAIPTIVLDSGTSTVTESQPQTNSGSSITASAIIVPVNKVQLSFANVGRVTSVNVNVGDKVNAEDVLIQLDTSILEAKVKEAEANLAAAQIQVKYLIRVGTDAKHLEVAENDVARAQALLDSANAILSAQSNLTAPFAGTIVSVNIAPSETVTPGQVVIVLGDLTAYQIETTDLSERFVGKIKIGQPADVFVEALNETFSAKVIDVARVSSTLGGDVVYKVTLAFDKQPTGLLWGMSADVEIKE